MQDKLGMTPLVEISPDLDTAKLAETFRQRGWVQIRQVLAPGSATNILDLLMNRTPWGLAWQAGPDGPHYVPAEDIAAMGPSDQAAILAKLNHAKRDAAAYSFAYSSHPLESSPHDRLLEGLNGAAFLELLRNVTDDKDIARVDGQATVYAPGHYLAAHTDEERERTRRVAYVLSMTAGDWRPEWGGYLNFYNDDGDIEVGIRPRFNCLNLFKVPRWHNVSQVLTDAPMARYAVTGWGRSS